MSALERHCRWLIALYPKPYRRQRGDEILATLIESANISSSWPTLLDTADLFGHAVRLRFRIDGGHPAGRILWTLAPGQLVMASLMSLLALLFGEISQLTGSYATHWQPGHLGPFYTAGPIAFSGWIAAGLSLALRRPRLTRWCVIVSMGLTAALVPLGHLVGVGRPPMYFLVFLVLLGVPYLAVPHQQVLRTPLPMWQRLLMLWPLILALAIAAQMVRLASARMVVGNGAAAFYRADFSPVGGGIAYIAWIVTGALVISLGCILTGHRMLGAAVSCLCLPWLVAWAGGHRYLFSLSHLGSSPAATVMVLGLIALVLIGQLAVPWGPSLQEGT
jgi:hypothetical protein